MVKRSSPFTSLKNIFDQISMSQRLSQKDSEYANYAGGSLEIANKIAKIDLCLEKQILPEGFKPLLNIYRDYLIKQRKAFFATIATKELSQLGFLLGVDTSGEIKASTEDFSKYLEE